MPLLSSPPTEPCQFSYKVNLLVKPRTRTHLFSKSSLLTARRINARKQGHFYTQKNRRRQRGSSQGRESAYLNRKKGDAYQRDFVDWNRSLWVLSQNNFILKKIFLKYCKDKIFSKCNISKNLYIYFEKQIAFLAEFSLPLPRKSGWLLCMCESTIFFT